MKKTLLILATAFAVSLHAADFPEGSPKFATANEVVTKAAKENGKPTILVFSASWCGPCQEMKKEVYKLAIVNNPNIIQGLLSLSIEQDHIFMDLLESAPFNIGKHKIIKNH